MVQLALQQKLGVPPGPERNAGLNRPPLSIDEIDPAVTVLVFADDPRGDITAERQIEFATRIDRRKAAGSQRDISAHLAVRSRGDDIDQTAEWRSQAAPLQGRGRPLDHFDAAHPDNTAEIVCLLVSGKDRQAVEIDFGRETAHGRRNEHVLFGPGRRHPGHIDQRLVQLAAILLLQQCVGDDLHRLRNFD